MIAIAGSLDPKVRAAAVGLTTGVSAICFTFAAHQILLLDILMVVDVADNEERFEDTWGSQSGATAVP